MGLLLLLEFELAILLHFLQFPLVLLSYSLVLVGILGLQALQLLFDGLLALGLGLLQLVGVVLFKFLDY